MKFDIEIGRAWHGGSWDTKTYEGVEAANEDDAYKDVAETRAWQDVSGSNLMGVFLMASRKSEEK